MPSSISFGPFRIHNHVQNSMYVTWGAPTLLTFISSHKQGALFQLYCHNLIIDWILNVCASRIDKSIDGVAAPIHNNDNIIVNTAIDNIIERVRTAIGVK